MQGKLPAIFCEKFTKAVFTTVQALYIIFLNISII